MTTEKIGGGYGIRHHYSNQQQSGSAVKSHIC